MGAYAHGHTHAHTHTVTIAERRDPRCAEHWRAGGDGGQGSAVWRGKSQQARVGTPTRHTSRPPPGRRRCASRAWPPGRQARLVGTEVRKVARTGVTAGLMVEWCVNECNKPTRTRGRKPLNLASLRLLSRGLADSHVAGDPGMRDGRGWADRLLAAAAHLPGAHLWSGQARHPTPSRHRARTEGASTRTCTHVRRCCKRVHVWPRALTCIDPLGSRRRKNGIGRLWL